MLSVRLSIVTCSPLWTAAPFQPLTWSWICQVRPAGLKEFAPGQMDVFARLTEMC
jgi:hypothetical protein